MKVKSRANLKTSKFYSKKFITLRFQLALRDKMIKELKGKNEILGKELIKLSKEILEIKNRINEKK
jgi:vacuolar-type H+-ATPase subunit D/Vma8